MTTVTVRTVGLVALFFSNWIMATSAVVMIILIGTKKQKGMKKPFGIIQLESDKPRCFVEMAALIVAIYGLYAFPPIGPSVGLFVAICAVVFVVLNLCRKAGLIN